MIASIHSFADRLFTVAVVFSISGFSPKHV